MMFLNFIYIFHPLVTHGTQEIERNPAPQPTPPAYKRLSLNDPELCPARPIPPVDEHLCVGKRTGTLCSARAHCPLLRTFLFGR